MTNGEVPPVEAIVSGVPPFEAKMPTPPPAAAVRPAKKVEAVEVGLIVETIGPGGKLNELKKAPVWAMVETLPPLPEKIPEPPAVKTAPNDAVPLKSMLGAKIVDKEEVPPVVAIKL